MTTSNLPGFYRRSPEARRALLRRFAPLTDAEVAAIGDTGALTMDQVDRMIENAVGTMPIPLGIATHFRIDGREHLVPMATEAPGIVAAISEAARLARAKGGFTTSSTGPVMIGQVQLVQVPDRSWALAAILGHRDEILRLANADHPDLVRLGGGAQDVEARLVDTARGTMVVAHLLVDCRDAMGPNLVDAMAEAVAPAMERWTGGRASLRIVSNLAVKRLARARAVYGRASIGGADVVDGLVSAYALAAADPFRAASHNKGILDGVDAVAMATGNDWRAIEAGAHAYAAWKTGVYGPLTTWETTASGDVVGTIELPMPVGLIGGATAVHPTAKAAVKLLGVETAEQLARVLAAVGLAQDFAALRGLATAGGRRGPGSRGGT